MIIYVSFSQSLATSHFSFVTFSQSLLSLSSSRCVLTRSSLRIRGNFFGSLVLLAWVLIYFHFPPGLCINQHDHFHFYSHFHFYFPKSQTRPGSSSPFYQIYHSNLHFFVAYFHFSIKENQQAPNFWQRSTAMFSTRATAFSVSGTL